MQNRQQLNALPSCQHAPMVSAPAPLEINITSSILQDANKVNAVVRTRKSHQIEEVKRPFVERIGLRMTQDVANPSLIQNFLETLNEGSFGAPIRRK